MKNNVSLSDAIVYGNVSNISVEVPGVVNASGELILESSMNDILGIDIGYGDVKVVYGDVSGNISKVFKFPSAIGITARSEYVSDVRVLDFKDHSYYVGENALLLPSSNMVDISEYKNLEYYAPLFLYYAMKTIGIDDVPDYVVCGLSKAQITNSGYFKEALEKFTVNGRTFEGNRISILPQGAGSKLTVDVYGDEFPNKQTDLNAVRTFIGVDIGFNTLDFFVVFNGKTSPSLFEGIEHQGVMKIAHSLGAFIKERFDRDISLHEAKEILDTGYYKLRGDYHDLSDQITEIKTQYLDEIQDLINKRYGNVIDKCDFVYLSGGGSVFFKDVASKGFYRVPKTKPEFYNAIGFYLYGKNNLL